MNNVNFFTPVIITNSYNWYKVKIKRPSTGMKAMWKPVWVTAEDPVVMSNYPLEDRYG